MKHLIAFIVIGLALGVLSASRVVGGRAKSPVSAILGGVVGGLAGGELLRQGAAGWLAMYGSLGLSVVLAAILAWLGRGIGLRS